MSAFSEYTRRRVLESLLCGVPWTPPETLYMGLFTEDGEVVGEGYSRLPVSPKSWHTVRSDDKVTRVANDRLEFPVARADWAGGKKISEWRCFDAATGGNHILTGLIAEGKTRSIEDGDAFYFPSGNVVIDLGQVG
jgi:hypothetical protein